MAELSDFVGTWRAERRAPYSSHTFIWVPSGKSLRGEWAIEPGTPTPGDPVRAPRGGTSRCLMQVGDPTLDGSRLLFSLNRGPYLTEFTLVTSDEAVVGAAVDQLPPEFAGPEHQRSIEGHRVRLLRQPEAAT